MNAHQRASIADEVLNNQVNRLYLLQTSFSLFPSHCNASSMGPWTKWWWCWGWRQQHGLLLIKVEQSVAPARNSNDCDVSASISISCLMACLIHHYFLPFTTPQHLWGRKPLHSKGRAAMGSSPWNLLVSPHAPSLRSRDSNQKGEWLTEVSAVSPVERQYPKSISDLEDEVYIRFESETTVSRIIEYTDLE